jgi:endoglucanase
MPIFPAGGALNRRSLTERLHAPARRRLGAPLGAALIGAVAGGSAIAAPSTRPLSAGLEGTASTRWSIFDLIGNRTPAPTRAVGRMLYVNSGSRAAKQAEAWRRSRPADAAVMDRIAAQPVASWIGDWNSDVRSAVNGVVTTAARAGAVPVIVAYNIPQRDCGSHSAGGARNGAAYRTWIRQFVAGLGGHAAIVVVEPDALGHTSCLTAAARTERYALIRDAVEQLAAKPNVSVYIDAGHAEWVPAAEMGARLVQAGVGRAAGFALNVSNFIGNSANIAYGEQVSRHTGGKSFVIDTSRNGAGPTADREWCNPAGRALGTAPTTDTGHRLVDAFLWIKAPGESDGSCGGGPRAGEWWSDYALGLAQRAGPAFASNSR